MKNKKKPDNVWISRVSFEKRRQALRVHVSGQRHGEVKEAPNNPFRIKNLQNSILIFE